tara:strand:- start:885 stop:1235 length:351 start_codon:yes stop_codon:yes gene_type:complete
MTPFILSFLGAVIQEVLHWLDLKQEMGGAVKITKSRDYWIITVVAIVLFTFATPFIVDGLVNGEKIKNWHYIVSSFAFPTVLRKLVKVLLKSGDDGTGATTSDAPKFKMREYFKIS